MYNLNCEQQLEMIAKGDHKEIMDYITHPDFFEGEAEVALIERGNHKEIMAYLQEYRFTQKAEAVLFRKAKGYDKELEISILRSFYKGEMHLVHFGHHKVVMAYLEDRKIWGEAETLLVQRGDSEEIMTNIVNHLSGDEEMAIILRGNHEEIMDYVTKYEFSDNRIVIALILRGNHEEIMAHIAKLDGSELGEFSDIAQVVFMQRGNHEEIMAYIAKYSFDEAIEVKLIERGNHEEIMAYLNSCNILGNDAAENALYERGNQEEIAFFGERADAYNSPSWAM